MQPGRIQDEESDSCSLKWPVIWSDVIRRFRSVCSRRILNAAFRSESTPCPSVVFWKAGVCYKGTNLKVTSCYFSEQVHGAGACFF